MRFWNTSSNKIELKYNSRTYSLEGSPLQSDDITKEVNSATSMKIPGDEVGAANMARHCLRDFRHLGLVVLKDGDDLQAKKEEGLKNYYNHVWDQLKNWNHFTDDKRNNGQTIIGEYPRVTAIKKEIHALEEALNLEHRIPAPQSTSQNKAPAFPAGFDEKTYQEFLQFLEFKKSQSIQSVNEESTVKKRGRPANVNTGAAQEEGAV